MSDRHVQRSDYVGVLMIGDPHLEGRAPGFRKDDYPRVILEKFRWCVSYAQSNRLLPVVLGDLFDKPRDNPTWMIGELIEVLAGIGCIGIYGNHDCADPELSDHDSLSLLVKARSIRLLDDAPWIGTMNGRAVVIGGSSYRLAIPDQFVVPTDGSAAADGSERPIVFWITHHDILVPGYEEHGRLKPRAIDRIDVVINGHIHRRLDDVQCGETLWITPGNISRRSRSDAATAHSPAALRIDITSGGYTRTMIEVPHAKHEDVFHAAVIDESIEHDPSLSRFIAGLAELQKRRTESGSGLVAFLEKNVSQFEQPVADEIMRLAKEVTTNATE